MTKEEQLRERLDREQERNRTLSREKRDELAAAARRIRELEKKLEPLEAADAERRELATRMRVAVETTTVARWNVDRSPPKGGPGIPTLCIGDIHGNQEIDAAQVFGVNAYSPEKARARVQRCFEKCVDIGMNHMVKPTKDGIVVPVLGDLLDLLNGRVHKGERQGRPVGIDAAAMVADMLQPGFILLADAYGGVSSYWVSGNHGRLTEKMTFEDRNANNLDYAVFKILEGRLRGDKRVRMEHATGPRIIWSVCGHRFMGLHGDPMSGMPKGGDSESGAVNLVARGVKRLRSLHMQIGQPFDVAVMGHFHTKIVLPGAIVNGAFPGFGELANGKAMPFEEPLQVMFYVHPKHGVTCHWPLYLGDPKPAARA